MICCLDETCDASASAPKVVPVFRLAALHVEVTAVLPPVREEGFEARAPRTSVRHHQRIHKAIHVAGKVADEPIRTGLRTTIIVNLSPFLSRAIR